MEEAHALAEKLLKQPSQALRGTKKIMSSYLR